MVQIFSAFFSISLKAVYKTPVNFVCDWCPKIASQYSLKKLGQDGEYLHFLDKKKFFFKKFAAHSWELSLFIKNKIFWSVIWKSNHCRNFIIIIVFIQVFALCLHFILKEEMLILFFSKQCGVTAVLINQESSLWNSLTLQ